MKERIQKIIAARGLTSRRKAEELLSLGRVTVNGQRASLGQSADGDLDTIAVDGVPLPPAPRAIWIMLHKPRGYVTTLSDEQGRKTAAELIDCGCRVYPVGRLDMDSQGLLLFTNDGALANAMMHPRGQVDKIYEVTVRGQTPETEALLARPIVLDGRPIAPPQVRLLRRGADQKAVYEIIIHEGRNRQVRRMCREAGLTVARLCRVGEGFLRLGDLAPGAWRYLTEEEIARLGRETGGQP